MVGEGGGEFDVGAGAERRGSEGEQREQGAQRERGSFHAEGSETEVLAADGADNSDQFKVGLAIHSRRGSGTSGRFGGETGKP